MLAKLEQYAALLSANELKRAKHVLIVLPKAQSLEALRGVPGIEALSSSLSRRKKKLEELAKSSLATDLPQGALATWVMVDPSLSMFEQQTVMRKAIQLALAEKPDELAIGVFGSAAGRRRAAELATYAVWVNGARLPVRKKKPDGNVLRTIRLFGFRSPDGFAAQRATAEGNLLCRELTVLPPNELTPGAYRQRIRQLAKQWRWRHEEYDMKRLRQLGAGAFVAVAQGSAEEDAAIVHLRYRHPKAKRTVALVGKGICFDTGGHNLKTARYMHGMHEDMNGSAVALGILLAATQTN